MLTSALYLTIFSCLAGVVLSLKCYECNVWKTGYGMTCKAPRIRPHCTVCMKFSTTIYMGYYKGIPRKSTITSRVCARSRLIRRDNACERIETMDGFTVRCYCNTDLCNGIPVTRPSTLLYSLPVVVLLASRWLGGVGS
ncbi:hypothetical protein NP493_180g07026 [Ridgeia piscesae]|uniref:Protein quiver n=1 Tax=Ridgeia piscesae TaxID=27915 RepID=A0AAD9P2N4_RIDPI|nr:hypothetical protein NP493_180g07026 [Ridgeia piscesae]